MISGWRNLVNALWHRPVATLEKSAKSLRRWFESPLGQILLSQQQPLINSLVEEYSAETQLLVSPSGAALLSRGKEEGGHTSRQELKIQLCPGVRNFKACGDSHYSPLVADLDAIPLLDNSVDFILLHHTLEFSENPHQVLREVARVLSPGGNLVIVGFNRWSLLGLRRWISQLTGVRTPWAHHPLSTGRLIDWMYLMSCEPMSIARGFYGLPIQYRRGMKWFKSVDDYLMRTTAPGGGFYMLHATKLLFGRSQQKRNLNRAADLIRLPVRSPAARVGNRHLYLVKKTLEDKSE
ncbi:MAG: methyltransferase domain-containing protein [Porticoccaceae bacterium]|nr:methyltransferase domain-containing protein [Porticoccaceae bacterium]